MLIPYYKEASKNNSLGAKNQAEAEAEGGPLASDPLVRGFPR